MTSEEKHASVTTEELTERTLKALEEESVYLSTSPESEVIVQSLEGSRSEPPQSPEQEATPFLATGARSIRGLGTAVPGSTAGRSDAASEHVALAIEPPLTAEAVQGVEGEAPGQSLHEQLVKAHGQQLPAHPFR